MAEQKESLQIERAAMSLEDGDSAAARRKLSFPVHQMQQYYRNGVLDNCSGKWSNLVDCLNLKTKRSSELQEILETREKESHHHIWSFRTREEAAANWRETFGHLDEME